jgi:hypothetical protein
VTDLSHFRQLVPPEHGLVSVSLSRPDQTIQSTVVNAGVLDHPLTGAPVVGFVIRGGTRKLDYLRARPQATVTIRAGWDWATAEGRVELAGPDDPLPGIDADRLRLLLREIFAAAGGTHDDWDSPDRVYSNPVR